jgi:hypothetical protein
MIEDAIGDFPRCIVHARRDVQLADSWRPPEFTLVAFVKRTGSRPFNHNSAKSLSPCSDKVLKTPGDHLQHLTC